MPVGECVCFLTGFFDFLGIGGSLSPSGDGLLADLFLGRPRSRRYPKFNIRRDIPLSRAIVPYYLAKETQEVLEILHHLASLVPLRELEFSLADGLIPILSRAA